jgi:hypothetical protein
MAYSGWLYAKNGGSSKGSIPAAWAFQDGQGPGADAAFARIRTQKAVVPSVWRFENRDILVVTERRGLRSRLPAFPASLVPAADSIGSGAGGECGSTAWAWSPSVGLRGVVPGARETIHLAAVDVELTAAARAKKSGLRS